VTGELLSVAVLDNGPGFPPDLIGQVGQPYQSSKGAGHGLGLFLAQTTARRLGGSLEAENRGGGGATVRLLLPLTSAGQGGSAGG
jgi:two-component system sensor histidine kinase RegB